MVKRYLADIAAEMGVRLSGVTVVAGKRFGCLDASLVTMNANDKMVSAVLFHKDIEQVAQGKNSDRLEVTIRRTLSRLDAGSAE